MTVSPMRPQLKGEVAKEKHTRNQWHPDEADQAIKVSQIKSLLKWFSGKKKHFQYDFSIDLKVLRHTSLS